MNSSKKMNLIFDVLNVSNQEIAKRGCVDPSLVSRYRSGSRLPSRTSKNFIKLCSGIASYAIDKNLWNKLSSICELCDEKTPEQAIMKFFLGPERESRQQENLYDDSCSYTNMSFSDKLKLMLDILDISNIMIARALNVDTSLISRMKSGERVPKKDSTLVHLMSTYFLKKIKTTHISEDTIRLFKIPIDALALDDETFVNKLSQWFLMDCCSSTVQAMDRFINKMNQEETPQFDLSRVYSQNSLPLPRVTPVFKKYVGVSGFREAVTGLLSNVASTNKSHLIEIYSDQAIDWLFLTKPSTAHSLSAITLQLLQNACRIKVIHNIHRYSDEMISGLEQWFPLYKTGLIEGYYCTTPSSSKFSHTIINVKGVGTIFGANAIGTENDGFYFYSELSEDLSCFGNQFNVLMKQSKPLAQVYNRASLNNYIYLRSKISHGQGVIKNLISAPSAHTMPFKLFSKIIHRIAAAHPLDPDESIEQYQYLHKQFNNALVNNTIVEYIYFPPLEDVKKNKVQVNLSDLFIVDSTPYHYSEYVEHISNLIDMLAHENYHIVPLRMPPTSHIRIIERDTDSASIFFNSSSALYIQHPYISRALDEYLGNTATNYRLPLNKKSDIINFLSTYIR